MLAPNIFPMHNDQGQRKPFALGLQEAGAQLITVHGRTRKQGFSGYANWEAISKIKKSLDIPVIANGDIKNSQDAIKCLEITKADGVMIGRASMGAPWLIGQIDEEIKNQKNFKQPDAKMKVSLSLEHLKLLVSKKELNKLLGPIKKDGLILFSFWVYV